MKEAVVHTKKYNHMDFDNMDAWFNVSFGFNSFNCVLGIITMQDFTIVSGIIGLMMQLILFLVKMYWMIRNNKNPDAEKHDINDAPLFERRCVGCATKFEPMHADQIFCKGDCKDAYMNDLTSRKPFIKPE